MMSNEIQSDSYFTHYRADVIDAIPSSAKQVLSVGCAFGVTEQMLVQRGIKVFGIECNPEAAAHARKNGLIVLEGDASTINLGELGETFDCMIYADVLEHLPDPLSVLRKHMQYLRLGGRIYVCVPNFRHISIFWELFIRGKVNYTEAGILDNTHIRITTRKMIQSWYEKCHVKVVKEIYHINSRRYKMASACLGGLAKDFFATQVGIIGEKC